MARPGGQRTRNLVVAIIAAAGAVAVLAGMTAALSGSGGAAVLVPIGGGLACLVTLVWILQSVLSLQRRDMEQLARAVEALEGHAAPRLAAPDRAHTDALVARLQSGVGRLLEQVAAPSGPTEGRLASVLATIPEGIVVVSASGLVTLVNQAATELVGAGQLEIGTSIFDFFERHAWQRTRDSLTDQAGTVEAELTTTAGTTLRVRLRDFVDHGGTVIVLPDAATAEAGLRHALEGHDDAPARVAPTPQTPLDRLAVVALDCETTGLNVALDRIISIGGVELSGLRIVAGRTVDVLVDPQQPIPAATTAIHGISDGIVRGAPTLAQAWPQIEPFLKDCIVVGHNIGFDLSLLEIELRRAGIDWQRPPSLCTLQLAAALEPELNDLNLESVARVYGIEASGRHTALGDALVTAEVYVRLATLLRQSGRGRLADAQAVAATARRIIRQQQAAGW